MSQDSRSLIRPFGPPSPGGRRTTRRAIPLPPGEGGAKRRVRDFAFCPYRFSGSFGINFNSIVAGVEPVALTLPATPLLSYPARNSVFIQAVFCTDSHANSL